MKRVITAVILIPLVLLAIFKLPLWALTILVGLVALLATDEYLRIVAGHNLDPMRMPTFLLVSVFYAMTLLSFLQKTAWGLAHIKTLQSILEPGSYVFFILSPLLYLTIGLKVKPLSSFLASAAAGSLALFYIAFTLVRLLAVVGLSKGPVLLVYGLVVVWIGDIAAYYTGRAIGKHLLAPKVSPKKTWEGTIASLLFSVLAGCFLLLKSAAVVDFFVNIHLLQAPASLSVLSAKNSVWLAILASASINIAAQVGDLAESAMKRGANIKDSGSLLPGHGGVLDRIDALLFAAPVLWYYASTNVIHF